MNEQTEDIYFDGKKGYCNVCSPAVYFTSAKAAVNHVMGSKHQKATGYHQYIRVMGPSYIEKMVQKVLSNKDCHTLTVSESFPNHQAHNNILGDKTEWLRCELCNNSVNSKQQYEIHKMGKKHKAKEEAKYGKKLMEVSIN